MTNSTPSTRIACIPIVEAFTFFLYVSGVSNITCLGYQDLTESMQGVSTGPFLHRIGRGQIDPLCRVTAANYFHYAVTASVMQTYAAFFISLSHGALAAEAMDQRLTSIRMINENLLDPMTCVCDANLNTIIGIIFMI